MACSAVALSVATVTSVLGAAALAIAFGTDNWAEIRVNRTAVRLLQPEASVDHDPVFFSRDEGLFRICFPGMEKPKGVPLYLSPVQTDCYNINYYIPEDEESDTFSDERWERLHMARSVVALFIVSFLLIGVSFLCGIAGCWKRSHGSIVATGLLQLLAALADAGAMGLWHGVQYYDYQKLKDDSSYYSWPDVLKQRYVTEFYYGWSYILAWLGAGLVLVTAVLFLAAARCLRDDKKLDHVKSLQHYLVYPTMDKRSPPYQPYGGFPPGYYYHSAAASSQYGMTAPYPY